MSAFLSSNDCISALAYYWHARSSRTNFTSPEAALTRAVMFWRQATSGDYDPQEDHDLVQVFLKATNGSVVRAVFGILLLENQASLAARYPDDDDMQDDTGYVYKRPQIVDYWIAQRTTGQMIGLLKGYEYQSCEHKGWESSVAYFICKQIRDYLLNDMETRDCPTDEMGHGRNWAHWSAPEDPRQVRLTELIGGNQ